MLDLFLTWVYCFCSSYICKYDSYMNRHFFTLMSQVLYCALAQHLWLHHHSRAELDLEQHVGMKSVNIWYHVLNCDSKNLKDIPGEDNVFRLPVWRLVYFSDFSKNEAGKLGWMLSWVIVHLLVFNSLIVMRHIQWLILVRKRVWMWNTELQTSGTCLWGCLACVAVM